MNNAGQVWRIAKFEFKRYFKWKQELLTIGLMVGGFLIAVMWPFIMALFESEQSVAFLSDADLPQAERIEFVRLPDNERERERALSDIGGRWDGVVLVDGFSTELRVDSRSGWQDRARTGLENWTRDQKIKSLPLDGEQRRLLDSDADIRVTVISDETGEAEDAEVPFKGFVTGGFIMLLFVGLMTAAGLMMTSITTEKVQRVTEQLLTLVSPQQWMDGKIISTTLHGLKAMAMIGVSLLVLLNIIAMVMGDQIMIPPLTILEFLNALLFIMLGLLLANSFLAGFSATIDDPNHSSRSMVIFAPMIPAMLSFSVLNSPESGLSTFLSIFPLTSFAAMPLRVVETSVPFWQWLLALILLLGMVWSMRSMAGRLFAMGIQMYGKEPGWKEIWAAMKGKTSAD